jgi:hypothetical protein
VGLEPAPLSLMGTIEELLEKKSSCISLEKPRLWPYGICRAAYATPLYPQKLALTSPTGGGCSVGIFCSWTQAMEFFFCSTARHCIVRMIVDEMGYWGTTWFPCNQIFQEGQNFKLLENKMLRIICALKT